jgi:uncharacterized membrane protein YfbV (UPF0208 family)
VETSGITHRVIRAGLLLTLAAVIAQAAAQSIDFGVYSLRVTALDSNVHGSIFGVISIVAQGATAVAMVVRARTASQPRVWALLAAVVGALTVVRIVTSYNAAVLIVPVAVVFVLVWQLTADDPVEARMVVRAGLLLLVFSFVVHAVGPKLVTALGYSVNSWPYEIKSMLKHGSEMAGWMLLAVGLVAPVRLSARAREVRSPA